MQISTKAMEISGGILIPPLMAFLGETLQVMIPWLITMFAIIVADLAAGIWKSYKLNIPIRVSKAFRDTMGKMIVYFAFVIMICCINVAAKDDFDYAKWFTLLIIVIEGGSIISNILKPHGINISLNAILKAVLTHSAVPLTCSEAEEIVTSKSLEEIRQEELAKQEENKKIEADKKPVKPKKSNS